MPDQRSRTLYVWIWLLEKTATAPTVVTQNNTGAALTITGSASGVKSWDWSGQWTDIDLRNK
jgi:hypothetical protein